MNPDSAHLPRLTVTIVVYNSPLPLLARTLHSLVAACEFLRNHSMSGVAIQLVDNGSSADYQRELTQLLAAQAWPDLTLETLDSNLGFGAGHNRALAAGVGDYHLVLNPDVELAPDALLRGLRTMSGNSSLVLLSPAACGGNGEPEFLCKRYPSVAVLLLRALLPRLGRRLFPAYMSRYDMSDVCGTEDAVDVPLASGCFMLLRGNAFVEVGGFDESFFLYFEDFDLSLRLGQLGSLRYEPTVHIVHHGGYAARKGWLHLKLFARSGWQFFSRHGWRWI
ncbi:glycosyltransferase [Seongchinamella sediminis]|uniref:Glycosyltransferase n=1 Tax=Seongchinamella sediminis TaxID=2283635 RepID=A0A3L7DYF3_9GAMM|nr:glycosyltransferase family 2 protein [Seongchinamella sediminis]RLQ21695.1 glycosyltransferase [Seongchinamella sediminis]